MAITPGDIVLARLRDQDGDLKLRPALVIALLPGQFQTVLVCGISTRSDGVVAGWDEYMDPNDTDFLDSGLHEPSILRLSFLAALPERMIPGRIGNISQQRSQRVGERIAAMIVTGN